VIVRKAALLQSRYRNRTDLEVHQRRGGTSGTMSAAPKKNPFPAPIAFYGIKSSNGGEELFHGLVGPGFFGLRKENNLSNPRLSSSTVRIFWCVRLERGPVGSPGVEKTKFTNFTGTFP